MRPLSDELLPDGTSFDDEPPIDLTPLVQPRLDRGAGGARWEDLVARIERAAEPELARRARLAGGVLDFVPVLARSLRPALVAAAAALLLSVGLIGTTTAPEPAELATTGVPAGDFVAGHLLGEAGDDRAIPVSASDAAWIEQQRAPSTAGLAEVIGLGGMP